MTNPQSRGEAMGLFDSNGNHIGYSGENASLLDRLMDRLPELPTIHGTPPPGLTKAIEEARKAIEAADDVLTEPENHTALARTPEEAADAEYRQALKAGEEASYNADKWRAKRIEVEAEFNKAVSVARAAVQRVKRQYKQDAPEMARAFSAEVLTARDAYLKAYADLEKAKHQFANAASQRAELLLAAGEDKEHTAIVNGESTVRGVGLMVSGKQFDHEPQFTAKAVLMKLQAHGAQGLDEGGA